MYKRRAHILFIAREDEVSVQACEVLSRQAGALMQGRCLRLDAGSAPPGLVGWADLVVALDAESCRRLGDGAITLRPWRCWSLPAGEGERLDFMQRQIDSMAAGMRMMQRLDG